MEKFKEKMKEYWLKAKAFLTKKWQGLPMYVWVLIFPIVLLILIYVFLTKSSKSTKW